MIQRLLSLCTSPPRWPLRQVTIYYLVGALLLYGLLTVWPGLADLLQGGGTEVGLLGSELESLGTISGAQVSGSAVQILVSMTGVFLLMIPVSWGYMGARRGTGFDQSVVQTMVILPIAVAGIVVMVKTSVALAFSLAGIVAGVRFRTTLSDTADALYIFTAIGVGLSAGIGVLGVGAVISIFFNYVILLFWSCDYGMCPTTGPQAGWSSGKSKKKAKRKKRMVGAATEPAGEIVDKPEIEDKPEIKDKPKPLIG